MNIINVVFDDLAYWIGAASIFTDQVHAPNLARIAESGTSFTNAYTPVALCSPARTAALSGQSPVTTGVFTNQESWRDGVAPEDTLPANFLQNGFHVASYGKVFHQKTIPADLGEKLFSEYTTVIGYRGGDPAPTEISPMPDSFTEEMADNVTADHAIGFLRSYDGDAPFMLNVGFVKPHKTFTVPERFYDLYPIEEIRVPGEGSEDLPGIPAVVLEELKYQGWHPKPDTPESWKKYVQAYLATVSYVDWEFGRLLDAVAATGHDGDTAIAVWSDHGYHLGDRDDRWGKFTLWEEAAKIPFIFSVPGVTGGETVDQVVSLLDLYPTLLDIAGLDIPARLEGMSLVPFLTDADLSLDRAVFTWMGDSIMMRTPQYSYIQYSDGTEELYDMVADPEQNHNLADEPAYQEDLGALWQRWYDAYGHTDPGPVGERTTIRGTPDDDNLTLTHGDDIGRGYDGADTIVGREGDDEITGGAGRDVLSGAEGNDTLKGGAWADVLRGNEGEDLILGGDHFDRLLGQEGRDTLLGQHGNDTMFGGEGADIILGGAGNDSAIGGSRFDTLMGEGGNDVLFGREGADSLFGNEGSDTLSGEDGSDTLVGGDGSDVLIGGTGADVLSPGTGRDTLRFEGRFGTDTVVGFTTSDTLIIEGVRLDEITATTRSEGILLTVSGAAEGTIMLEGVFSLDVADVIAGLI
ncbi:hypothetical protein DLJ53_31765 [Acuticoccus sediminis]|uniref:Sulfatase N-terminal domain-containing protein n=1 Tax=Acuticoccus sediminis TaxID=2184697 RepID=A0A8B2NGE9_9HYPH|nr:sulfatase-like hydrolase/transferase [Acuticoccus sediminis]RAH96834.1 hypothetical protein DLJ53_31765 [Acuticoccus sediminis]